MLFSSSIEEGRGGVTVTTNPADNVIVIGKMGLALLAPKDLVCCEIYVVFKAHDDYNADDAPP